ncbi:hypothetical protein PFICI_03593 [Pestalotiopsis fici W106-1]|uniref:DUF8021 domain-containing protein n=1 Tax=Pestalotiopsis fici (strain W106-1 / CGMCC3.15140) TaxID=1229662 RepID=W3XHL3_PESFW|nr:uncharacterized protein PFICI_03593 [Pestalotiopsis fici W106-1]ETS85568.1 hypothetical protein PFICI_03593 [Pestalotiopsis fici W106-1]
MHVATVYTVMSLAVPTAAACTRDLLQNATAEYVKSQSSGHIGISALSSKVNYTENDVPVDINTGVLTQPLKIDFNRSTHDTTQCATFTELIVTDPKHPYVIGTRMVFTDDEITTVESIVTDAGDWLFNATGYLYWNAQENWAPIPADRRDTRAVIQAAGDAYFNRFANVNVTVPWAASCARLEGGLYTDTNHTGAETCGLGLPSTIKVTNRRYVVDEEMGTVDIFLGFPGLDRSVGQKPVPDSHFFRVENGKIRYIHTVSACFNAGCGENGTLPLSRIRRPMSVKDSRRLW